MPGGCRARHRVATLACDLSGHAACIFRNHFAETVALDSHLLSGFDLVIELDQMLDEPALGRKDRQRTVPIKTPTSLPVRPIGPARMP